MCDLFKYGEKNKLGQNDEGSDSITKEKDSITSEEVQACSDSTVTVSEQLYKIENLLANLDNRISASERNLGGKIEDNFEKLRSEIFLLQKSYDELKEKYDDAEDTIEDLQDEVSQLKKELSRERERRNNLEQYQRRDCLRFLGVGPDSGREMEMETEKKVLAVINTDLKLDHISASDISIAHRVGRQGSTKPRAIIVKFMSRKVKNLVLGKRRLLKGTGRGIIEDLTPLNFTRLNRVKEHHNVKNVWTKEGVITALLKNGKILRVEEGNFEVLGTDNEIPETEKQSVHDDQRRAVGPQTSSSRGQDASHRERTQSQIDAPSPARSTVTGSTNYTSASSGRDLQHRTRASTRVI